MSTKNLSRTVIEGGRSGYSRNDRRASHGRERASTRAWLEAAYLDDEHADATTPSPRPHAERTFADKLGPAYRWLASQIGRPWSKVYAELVARFDTRTIAGRHIVHDHMLTSVRTSASNRYRSRHDLIVDAHGILRAAPWMRHRSYRRYRERKLAWARAADGQQRVCALTHRGWWWFRPHGPCPVCWHARAGCRSYHRDTRVPRDDRPLIGDGPLSRRQIRRLQGLPEDFRDQLVIPNPWARRA